MHPIETTNGFVIDSRPFGEAGKMFSIFTEDFGLIQVRAQGIRLEKSKLRYQVCEYAFGSFSFVKGREYWRLTSAEKSGHDFSGSKERYIVAIKVAALLKRLLHGEEKHTDLFIHVNDLYSLLSTINLNDEELKTLESLSVLRILHSLGYVTPNEGLKEYVEASLTMNLIQKAKAERTKINGQINRALRESHL